MLLSRGSFLVNIEAMKAVSRPLLCAIFKYGFLYASFCAHCGMTGMTVGPMLIILWHCKLIKCWWYGYEHEMTKYVGKISPRNSRRLLRNTQTIFGEYFLPHPVVDRAHDATIASAFKLSAHLKRYWNKTVSKQFWNCFSFVSIKRTILRILYMQCFIEYVHLFIFFLLSVVRFCIGPYHSFHSGWLLTRSLQSISYAVFNWTKTPRRLLFQSSSGQRSGEGHVLIRSDLTMEMAAVTRSGRPSVNPSVSVCLAASMSVPLCVSSLDRKALSCRVWNGEVYNDNGQ